MEGSQVEPRARPRVSEVSVRGLRHAFEHSVALAGIDLAIGGGEFMTLLGPSGSGKTTLLRIIAGLVEPTAGSVFIDEVDVTSLPTQQRDISFVFQSYALFPHLTVAQNIEFPLRMRKFDRRGRARRIIDMLELVELADLGNRMPSQLSGGQQQRVALARALAHRPKVLLLDEPLGALDRRLRQQLGSELRRILREAAVTTIYVTHDQEEAFILSDRVAVMSGGLIHQVGTPIEIYTRPADMFVANFVGETNTFTGRIAEIEGDQACVEVNGRVVTCRTVRSVAMGRTVDCVLRPEQTLVDMKGGGFGGREAVETIGAARVDDVIFLGNRYRLVMSQTQGGKLLADAEMGAKVPQLGAVVTVGCVRAAPTIVAHSDDAISQ
jgi:ABC-type Fe3+/spermidine/putrescine transport system ATPase subunit